MRFTSSLLAFSPPLVLKDELASRPPKSLPIPEELYAIIIGIALGDKRKFSSSSLNFGKPSKGLTNAQRSSFSIPQHLHEVIIGSCLGDLYISKRYTNAILQFEQGKINEKYILHLYDLFKDLCPSPPKRYDRKPDSRTGKVYSRIVFSTYSLPCLNYYHELFYVDRVKRVPLNIGEFLTSASLAYWAMDDGYKLGSGFSFSTESYSLSEVELLIKVLKENFDLICTYHKHGKTQYRLYIKSGSMNKFRSLVTPYFHDSMMYKLD